MSKQEQYNDKIKQLDELQFKVTQESATERPFTGEYDDFYEKGIYYEEKNIYNLYALFAVYRGKLWS